MSTSSSPRPAAVVHLRPTPLLIRLRAQQPDAVAEVFDRHADAVERAVRGVLGPDPEVDDVVQDAFVAALRGIDGFRGEEAKLGAWLRGIAVRQALKKLRWRRRRRWLSLRGSDVVPTLHAPTDTDTQAALQRAYALLERLAPLRRAAFGLRAIEGLQLDEVADALGVSLATVKRHIRAAREELGAMAARDVLLREWVSKEATR